MATATSAALIIDGELRGVCESMPPLFLELEPAEAVLILELGQRAAGSPGCPHELRGMIAALSERLINGFPPRGKMLLDREYGPTNFV